MQKEKSVKKTVYEVTDVFCNKCTKSCKSKSGGFYYSRIHYLGGYESTDFRDSEEIYFDLCEKCLMEIVNSLKIKVR